MIDYKIYCPSYKRSQTAFSHEIFDKNSFCYVVREEEADLYKHFDRELIVIPNGQGVVDIARTRNWILENKQSKYVVMVDDDMSAINRITYRKTEKLSSEAIHEMMTMGFIMAEEAKCGQWGINTLPDPRAYSINMPFYFSSVCLGPFMAILDTTVRIDERFTVKEDYDMFLQQYFKHGRVLRFNMYHYIVDHQKMRGGVQEYRKKEIEHEQNELLKKKWGEKIVRKNKWAKDSINPNVRI